MTRSWRPYVGRTPPAKQLLKGECGPTPSNRSRMASTNYVWGRFVALQRFSTSHILRDENLSLTR